MQVRGQIDPVESENSVCAKMTGVCESSNASVPMESNRIDEFEWLSPMNRRGFERREVVYELGELDEVSLAYAITIHKSQGSEFPAVVIPLATQHYLLLQRNLVYTGITRCKGVGGAAQGIGDRGAEQQDGRPLLRPALTVKGVGMS